MGQRYYLETVMKVNSKGLEGGLSRSNDKLRRHAKVAKRAAAANDSLSGGFKRAANSIAILEGPLGGTAGRLSSIAAGLNAVGPAGLAAGLGVAAGAGLMSKGIAVLIESERQMLRSEALLNSTGFASGQTAASLDRMARDVALSTLASTQGIRDAQAVLLTFKSVSGDTFKRTISLAQDMAAVMGTDAKSSALQLGKALEDPTKGLNALTRSGVSFTETEKDKIKVLAESGKLLDAQGMLLDKIAGQFGGAAKKEAESLAGAIDTLSQRFDQLAEAAAKAAGADSALESFLNRVSKGMAKATEALKPDDGSGLFAERLDLVMQLTQAEQDLANMGYDDTAQINLIELLKERIAATDELMKTHIDGQQKIIDKEKEAYEKAEETQRLMRQQAEEAARIADEEERRVKAQKESLKLSKSRSGKSGSLYNKLFTKKPEEKKNFRSNTAFESDAKAAMRMIEAGFTDGAKKFLAGATGTYTSSKKAGDLYDTQGMKDVILMLREKAGLESVDIDNPKRKKSKDADGESYGMVKFSDSDAKFFEAIAKNTEEMNKKIDEWKKDRDMSAKDANDQQKPTKKFVLEIKKAGTDEGVSITAETKDDLDGRMANFLEDVASAF